MDYTLKSPVSDLPTIDFITSQSVLHLVQFPFTQGYQFSLSELQNNTPLEYVLNSKNSETSSYIEWTNIDNVPLFKDWVFPPPTSSYDFGIEGQQSRDNRFHYIYSYGLWRRRLISNFNE